MKVCVLILVFVVFSNGVAWAQEPERDTENEKALPKEGEVEESAAQPGIDESGEPKLLTKEELKKVMLPPLPV